VSKRDLSSEEVRDRTIPVKSEDVHVSTNILRFVGALKYPGCRQVVTEAAEVGVTAAEVSVKAASEDEMRRLGMRYGGIHITSQQGESPTSFPRLFQPRDAERRGYQASILWPPLQYCSLRFYYW
jgi:hypothetical protein